MRKNKKHLDFELNLVPFIDLLSVCICFLLITAVWLNVGSLNVKQAVGGQSAAETEKKPLMMVVLEATGEVNLEVQETQRVPANSPPSGKPKGIQPEGLDEMVRTAASLEHLAPLEKAELGEWMAQRLKESSAGGPWAWALGRVGARVPVYGSGHKTVAPARAEAWVRLLVELGLERRQ